MLWMEAEIVQMFLHSLFFKGDLTRLFLKAWPPHLFLYTAVTLPSHHIGKYIHGFQCLLILKNIPAQ